MAEFFKKAWAKIVAIALAIGGVILIVLRVKKRVTPAPVEKPKPTHVEHAAQQITEVRLRGEAEATQVRVEAAKAEGQIDQIEAELQNHPEAAREALANRLRDKL